MSSTSQLTTFSDLYTDLQNRVRVTTGVSATVIQAKRYINIALNDVHLGFDYKYPWCERQGTLLTNAPYSDGTLSVSVGSTTVAGTSTLWNQTNSYGVANVRQGGKIAIAGTTDVYRVSAVTSNILLTLGTRYVASSNASFSDYTYFEDEYALASDFLRLTDLHCFSSDWNIPIISRTEFRARYGYRQVRGKPAVACLLDEGFNGTTTPVRKVQFYPAPDTTYVIPYDYVTNAVGVDASGNNLTSLSSDTDEPIIPLRYRHVIVLGALYHWYRDKRDDSRSKEVKAEYVDLVQRIVSDHDIGTHAKAQIQPGGGYWSAAHRPYSRRSAVIRDLNHEFDWFRR